MDKQNLTKLSDYQLYEVIANVNLDYQIRRLAKAEFLLRKLDEKKLEEIILKHNQRITPLKKDALSPLIKMILIFFPFVLSTPILGIIAGRFLAKGYKKKTKELWFYTSIGYLFWTIVAILIARFFLFSNVKSS